MLPNLWVPYIEKFLEDNRIDDVATTSLNFWAIVLQLQDIKTRYALPANDEGIPIQDVHEEAYQQAAAKYAALNSTAASLRLGRAISRLMGPLFESDAFSMVAVRVAIWLGEHERLWNRNSMPILQP